MVVGARADNRVGSAAYVRGLRRAFSSSVFEIECGERSPVRSNVRGVLRVAWMCVVVGVGAGCDVLIGLRAHS
jgi:hypothetical protein